MKICNNLSLILPINQLLLKGYNNQGNVISQMKNHPKYHPDMSLIPSHTTATFKKYPKLKFDKV